MPNGSIKIKIDGDDSGLRKTLDSQEKSARSAAAALGQSYQKAGMAASAAMSKAWAEIKKAQADGTSVMINGVETFISANEKAVNSIEKMANANEKVADSADKTVDATEKIVDTNDKIIHQGDGISKTYDDLGEGAEDAAQAVAKAADQVARSSANLSGIKIGVKAGLADIKAGIDMTAAALGKLISVAQKGVNYNAQIEQLKTSFEVMTGSAEKAADVIERLRVMGAETPFEMSDLASTTQLLMQYGFTADDAIEKMTMLGDIAQGNAQAMTSIATGYAQMSSAGKVNLQDIKQMINGGFNPLQEISERTGESMADLYDRISKGTMSIDEITESMRAATSEGGKFYQSMEKQSKTLSGQLSTLKDNAMQLLGSMTGDLSEEMSSVMLPMVNNMVSELQNAFDRGGFDALLETATNMIPDLLGMMTGKIEDAISGLSRWLPQGVDQLMAAVPGAISSATEVLPQITTALFGVASTVVRDLVGMLPELIPALAEGVLNMASSMVAGVQDMVTGLFDGVEQAFHQGEKKIAGVWINADNAAKYHFGMDMEVDVSGAKSAIQTAYSEIRDALDAGPLTEEQKAEILSMLGEDASAIKAKLMEFGLSEAEAGPIADQISRSGETIRTALNNLNIGADAGTVLKWFGQANGSNIALMHYAKAAGLSDEDVNQIVGLYNEANGRLSNETPNFAQTIYEKLTDGLADDEETVTGLKEQAESWVSRKLEELEEGYQEAVGKLNLSDPDYEAKLAALQTQYETAKAEVESIRADSLTIIDALAGQSTKSVENAYQTIADVESRINALEERVQALKGEALTQAEQAFKVVTAGGKADEATIEMAVNLKFNEFKVDEQAAEDAYTETVNDLNEKLSKNEITVEEFNAGMADAEAQKAQAIALAKANYEAAFGEILKGIAESEGQAAAFSDDAAIKAKAAQMVSDIMAAASEVGWENVDPGQKQAVADMLTNLLGEGFTVEDMDMSVPATKLSTALAALTEDLDTTALEGKVGEVYSAALEDGILEGTSFDTSNASEQVAAVFASTFSGAEPGAAASGQELGKAATSKMGDEPGAKSAAGESVRGLQSGLVAAATVAYEAGARAGKAFAKGYRDNQEIQSPSRVMRRLGEYSGKGLELGLRDSMERAVRVAKQLSGQIVTAADLHSAMRVNVPNLQQEITLANEQTTTTVNLDGKQIAEIQGANNASELAWIRAKNAKGYGYR